MKFVILASILMSAVSSVSFANEICGTLGTREVMPNCTPGQACPMWVRLQYDLTTEEGIHYDLGSKTMGLLTQFTELKGDQVCVSGSLSQDIFEVSSINLK